MNNRSLLERTVSAGAVIICTAVAWALTPYLTTIDQAMLYFVGVVIVASRTGTWPSFASVIMSIAAFNFFFVPPRLTFAVHDTRYVVTFAVMFLVAFAISRLTNQVHRQADESNLRERQTAALYEMSRELLRERNPEQPGHSSRAYRSSAGGKGSFHPARSKRDAGIHFCWGC